MYKMITPLLNHLVGGGIQSTVKKIQIQTFCYGIIGIALFIALIFLCITGFLTLCLVMSPLAAASTLFFIWLFVAGLSAVLCKLLKSYHRHDHQKQWEKQRHKLITTSALSSLTILNKH
ncbi:MAG: phage holin family protein, partial [Bartonella sp.]|nr:phage holin family protein [Bartonella sp.]